MPIELFKKEAPQVAEAFFDVFKALKEQCVVLDDKTCELILIAVLTANRSKGIANHVRGAKEKGITDKEIITAISMTLPICGIDTVIHGLECAKEVLDFESQSKQITQ